MSTSSGSMTSELRAQIQELLKDRGLLVDWVLVVDVVDHETEERSIGILGDKDNPSPDWQVMGMLDYASNVVSEGNDGQD